MKVVRSISLEVGLLQRVATTAEENGDSVSRWIEDACKERIAREGATARVKEDAGLPALGPRRAVTYPKNARRKKAAAKRK